ncbi:hypothetical protein HRI96_00805 [Treponema parvum]|uniref:SH3 domain-containing protein n=1 Tax=Treponema parvum TaxID=138851 RepID=A0A975IBI1_9SPIR|nr:hypothetical protein [Treponema parvum]QTQ10858.1 hypothetical protein HRI96_00805 [Treponema parvum]
MNKKSFLSILFCFSVSFVFALGNYQNKEISDFLYTKYNIKGDKFRVSFKESNYNSQIAGLTIERDGTICLYVGTSGYYLYLSSISIDEYELNLSFIEIWIGAEEGVSSEKRVMYKYKARVLRNEIENNESWMLRIYDIPELFKAIDVYGSVAKNGMKFFVNEPTFVRYDSNLFSRQLFELNPESYFDIIDVVQTENKIWLKISFSGKEGFIPFTALADKWTV